MPYPEQIDGSDLLRLRLEQLDGYAEVSLAGEIDLATADALERRLADVAASSGDGDLVVDLRDVTFIDSTGLRVFIVLHQRLEDEGRRLVLRRPLHGTRRIIQISCGEGYLHLDPE